MEVLSLSQKKNGDASMQETLDHCMREHPNSKVCMLKAMPIEKKIKFKSVHFGATVADLIVTPTADPERLVIQAPSEQSQLSPVINKAKHRELPERSPSKELVGSEETDYHNRYRLYNDLGNVHIYLITNLFKVML